MSISVETLALAKDYTDKHGGGGGTGGTTNYNDLTNKPSINGVQLSGNKTSAELGIQDGAPGEAATITISSTETVAAGTPAAFVELSGSTPQNRLYKAQIPKGSQGDPGPTGPQGPQGPAGAGLPPTDNAQAGDVPTWDGENVVWNPPAGGEKLWRLINTISLTEPARTVLVSQDSDGNPFEVNELLIRGWLTCSESSRKNANIGVNGSALNIAGNLKLIKNVGYFAPCEIHIYNDCGLYGTHIIYTDTATQADPPALNKAIISQSSNVENRIPSVPYEKITSFGIMATDTTVTLSEKCMLQIYGR